MSSYVYDPLVDQEKVIEIYNLNIMKEIPKNEFDAILIAVGHECFKDFGIDEIKKFHKGNDLY